MNQRRNAVYYTESSLVFLTRDKHFFLMNIKIKNESN